VGEAQALHDIEADVSQPHAPQDTYFKDASSLPRGFAVFVQRRQQQPYMARPAGQLANLQVSTRQPWPRQDQYQELDPVIQAAVNALKVGLETLLQARGTYATRELLEVIFQQQVDARQSSYQQMWQPRLHTATALQQPATNLMVATVTHPPEVRFSQSMQYLQHQLEEDQQVSTCSDYEMRPCTPGPQQQRE
jgi:hypothetical protein